MYGTSANFRMVKFAPRVETSPPSVSWTRLPSGSEASTSGLAMLIERPARWASCTTKELSLRAPKEMPVGRSRYSRW